MHQIKFNREEKTYSIEESDQHSCNEFDGTMHSTDGTECNGEYGFGYSEEELEKALDVEIEEPREKFNG